MMEHLTDVVQYPQRGDSMTKTHSERQMEFNKQNIKVYRMDLNIRTDADIIEHLDKQQSKQGYIKQLIRQDIAREKPAE